MPVLALGTPVTVADPVLLVENRLKPGRYRFELVVTDTAGLESDARAAGCDRVRAGARTHAYAHAAAR